KLAVVDARMGLTVRALARLEIRRNDYRAKLGSYPHHAGQRREGLRKGAKDGELLRCRRQLLDLGGRAIHAGTAFGRVPVMRRDLESQSARNDDGCSGNADNDPEEP